jgi:alpha-tubulin suppressor-like RCC1 family protein
MAIVELGNNNSIQINKGVSIVVGPHSAPAPVVNYALWSWGYNSDGSLGNYNYNNASYPQPVATDILTWSYLGKAVSASHYGAITTSGNLYMWGSNQYGQIGNNELFSVSSPIQIGTESNWEKVATGFNKTFASKTDGTLWAWGRNYYQGYLGNNAIYDKSSPVMIMSSGSTWTSVSTGYSFSCAVRSDGRLYTWGDNAYGQLGHNNLQLRSSPTQVGTSTDWNIATCGNQHCLAIKKDGTLWSWGANIRGALGLGITQHRSSPVQVGSQTDWTFVVAGTNNSFGLRNSGHIFGWGDGSNRNTVLGGSTNTSSPTQIMEDRTFLSVATNVYNTGALGTDGTIWTWGTNYAGSLGNGVDSINVETSPLQVADASTNWTDLTTGYISYIAKK